MRKLFSCGTVSGAVAEAGIWDLGFGESQKLPFEFILLSLCRNLLLDRAVAAGSSGDAHACAVLRGDRQRAAPELARREQDAGRSHCS